MELNNLVKQLTGNRLLILALGIGLIIILVFFGKYESFEEIKIAPTNDIIKLIESIDVNKLEHSRIYTPLNIDSLTNKLTKKALEDNNLRKVIEQKSINIYGEIISNDKLKNYLKFMNLINQEGLPSFINESESELLSNQIKIILTTMPKSQFQLFKV